MKKTKSSLSAFFVLRILLGVALCFVGASLAVVAIKKPGLSGSTVAVNEENKRDVVSEENERETRLRTMPVPDEDVGAENDKLNTLEQYWMDRLTYPTGNFNPDWVRAAAKQDGLLPQAIPAGSFANLKASQAKGVKGAKKDGLQPNALSTTGWTALGPQVERMTGCSGCFDYTKTSGRVNNIVVDPTTTTNGSIVAYAATVGGGVWKTTNCCNSATTWNVTTDDPLISTTPIDTITIDPNNHNTVYAGTGDLNYGSFSMGSQGILKTVDGGNSWSVLGATVFGPGYTQPAGQYPQYDAVGKVRVDPNNSNNVVAGTKKGLFFSYDGGNNWTGPCLTNSFTTQRQDITGLELTNIGGLTRIIAAVGVRGFPTVVQFDLGLNGANGIYKADMPASGCPSFTSIARNDNGFVFGNAVTGSGYATGAPLGAGSGVACNYPITGGTATFCTSAVNNLSRVDIAVAPSNPNYIYAQVTSINWNNNSQCGNTTGCQLGVFASADGGNTWSMMQGSAGGALRDCNNAAGDYNQNWYDQAVAVDPNNPERIYVSTTDIWFATRTGTTFNNTSCVYSPALVIHADQHALAFVPGSSSMLLAGHDGGLGIAANADAATSTVDPTWVNMDNNINTIEFYAGDISGNFATDPNPQAVGGAQDNGPSSVKFSGSPTGPAQWQMGTGGDGFSGQIDPVGTGSTQAQGTITLTTGGAVAGEQFVVGPQTFTFQTAARSGTGQVQLNSSTTTEGNNIVTAINADIPSTATAVRSGAAVIVTATNGGPAGNSIPFTENVTNFTMDDSGFLGGRTAGSNTGQLRFWEGNNSGGFSRCVINCTVGGATWTSSRGAWTGDQQSFVLPVNIFHGGVPGGDDCAPAALTNGGCGHLLAGTMRVYETISGTAATVPTSAWVVTNNTTTTPSCGTTTGACLTKGTLGNRSYINQVKYSPKYQSVAIVGTNDGNVQIGFNLGTGTAGAANWVNVTGSNTVLPNRPVLGISLDPSVSSATTPVGYAAVGGFNANTPATPGHLFQVTCTTSNCGAFTWLDKTGNLPDIPVDSVINNPNYPQQVFAGTDWGVYFTNDITQASPTWYRFDSGMPHTMIWDLQIDRGSTTLSAWTRGRGAWVFPLPSANLNAAPILLSAVSELTHPGAGTFDINIPISGTTGVEPRSDGTGNYKIILTFDQPVNAGTASVTSGTGNVNTVSFSGNTMTLNLTGVTDQQVVAVTANGVAGTATLSSSPDVRVGFLQGDCTLDREVNVADTVVVRSHAGVVNASTCQYDVNLDGQIDVADTIIVRSKSGNYVP